MIDHVIMDREPEEIISEETCGHPTNIAAGPACASNRDRLFWIDFTITPGEGETLNKGPIRNELILKPDPLGLNFWDTA